MADLEVGQLVLALKLFPGQPNPSRSSTAWKALFGLRCPSRDTRAQTGGETTSPRETTSAVPSASLPTDQPPESRATGWPFGVPRLCTSQLVGVLFDTLAGARRESASAIQAMLVSKLSRFPGVVWDY
jgi:hypothetical protein